MSTFDITKIRNRKAEIATERGKLDEEEAELDTALAVISRLGGRSAETVELTAAGKAKRPNDTPSLWIMVETVLTEQRNGLGLSDLVAAVRAKYWPGLHRDQVAPNIYNFAKEGRLVKDGSMFKLPK